MSNTVFLAWQAPQSRRWYPIGRLRQEGETYTFVYTQGAIQARAQSGFRTLVSFPDLHERYESDEIFPLFENRVLASGRPEYSDFIEWLSIPRDEADPIAILARSGGHRATDTLEVFPCPEQDEAGRFRVHFFIHGLRHQTPTSQSRASRLESGERLRLQADYQNERDPHAQSLRTDEREPGDMHILGYLPRYLAHDVARMPEKSADWPRVEVERVNPSAPVHFRVLCSLSMSTSENFSMFTSEEFEPIDSEGKAN